MQLDPLVAPTVKKPAVLREFAPSVAAEVPQELADVLVTEVRAPPTKYSPIAAASVTATIPVAPRLSLTSVPCPKTPPPLDHRITPVEFSDNPSDG